MLPLSEKCSVAVIKSESKKLLMTYSLVILLQITGK